MKTYTMDITADDYIHYEKFEAANDEIAIGIVLYIIKNDVRVVRAILLDENRNLVKQLKSEKD